jgi:dimethylglycine dehydrogenase
MDKGNFVGKAALLERQKSGPTRKLVSLSVNCTHAPAHPGASLMDGDTVVGTVSSGDWGHRVGMNLAYAFVEPEFADIGSTMELDLCGERILSTVIPPSPYDPDFSRLRQ